MISKIKCLICSGENLKDHRVGLTELIHCLTCDIYFLKNIPREEELQKYYENQYQTTGSIFEAGHRRVFRFPEQISLISEIMRYVKPPASLLDIGCDKGFFIDEARRYGFTVEGLEPSQKAREYCLNIGIKIFSSLHDVSNKYSIITLWHSLEHHPNPIKTMQKIKSNLTKGGYVFIRVPDFDCVWRKIFRELWIWFQPQNHYFHFTVRSLKNLLEQSGFEVIKIERRKPNTFFTQRAACLSDHIFKKYFNISPSVKEKAVRFYEHITGVELIGIGRVK